MEILMPIAVTKKIDWFSPDDWSADQIDYYAAQGNATRVFMGRKFSTRLNNWKLVKPIRLSALSYAASGGYSTHQLYPTKMLPILRKFEKILDQFPILFATRQFVILEK